MRHEDKQFFDMTLNPAAELALDVANGSSMEWTAQRQQPLFQRQLPPGWGPSVGCRRPLPGLGVEPLRSMGPPGQCCIFRVQRLQFVDVPQQVGPASLLQAGEWSLEA